ncbi:hypothetical protein EHQ68_00755 [Leptospira congkakensis]|uniref:Outer membrane protein beta-barrel domain-containing protein n=1 Tax=Leptospira congkakensis TaxID=2484932 RepID=A0A4Z1ADM9_9LEPT|nr:hypothetical protein [Leptospira congkakensis]TGL87924.1 hypothetical protein EHQ69_17690 [Leptospira congkakensis]TGL92701.1 hypothetical protein EHQ68_00755 [Leptospira congkakensis]TGL96074.1 hypothetical protein EHQ70_13360 [Leptospira congkakensis]
MKFATNLSYLFSILFLFTGLTVSVFSQTTPAPKREIYSGFYKGGFYLQLAGGDIIFTGGSLLKRETSLQNSLKTQADWGVLPKRFIGGINVPNGIPLPESKIYTGRTERVVVEYGITDHIGFTASLSNNTVNGKRLNQFISADRTNPNGYSPYLEVLPTSYTFYEDKIYGLGLNYHILSKSKFDPYVGIELGLVNFRTSYRSYTNNSNFLYSSMVSGIGYSGRLASGFNYHITPEFGLMLEVYGMKRMLKSSAFPSESFDQVGFQFGVLFNLDNIGQL